jgi:hypothetical protein
MRPTGATRTIRPLRSEHQRSTPNQSRDQRIDPIDNRGRQDIPQSESSPESQPPEPEPSCSGSPAIGLGREVIFGVEGTGSYGAGLASALRRRGIGMPKVLRTGRRDRRLRGKRWPVD